MITPPKAALGAGPVDPAPLLRAPIDEHALPGARQALLAPAQLRGLLARLIHVLINAPPGFGKSFGIDALLADPATYPEGTLVVVLAPTWDILNERPIVKGAAPAPVPHVVLRPRPASRCGARDARWRRLEAAGNGAYARETLCADCPARRGPDPCAWPSRFQGEAWEGVRLVFTTDAHMLTNRNFLGFLRARTGAERVVLVMDEGHVVSGSFELVLTSEQLAAFRAAVAAAEGVPEGLRDTWLRSLDTLMRADEGLADAGWRFPAALNACALAIQKAGLARDPGFRYLGYDLAQFPASRPGERWRDAGGNVRFTVRPYLADQTLIFSAHLRPAFVAHRLGLESVAAPYESLRARHSGTRIYNLENKIGMERYFKNNAPQILRFFAALIARNVLLGRRTLLVSRKAEKALCAEQLTQILVAYGLPEVSFPTEDYAMHDLTKPTTVPLIHFGVVGVNTFQDFDACYCLNSYYVPDHALDRSLQEHEPESFKIPVVARVGADRRRHVQVADPAHAASGLDRLGDEHLRKLEVDPVLQAVGRVRFHTRPREVFFFHMADLEPEVGPVEVFASLAAARAALGVPSFVDLRNAAVAARVAKRVAAGASIAAAAEAEGVNRETARRWVRHKNPLEIIQRGFVPGGAA